MYDFYQKAINGGTEDVLLESSENKNVYDWSPDGRFILYAVQNAKTGNDLWAMALSKWDPSKRALSESFFKPDENLIRAAVEEKSEAIRLASEALRSIEQARGKLSDLDAEQLRYWFEKLRDSAELWRYLSELYLRHRQVSGSAAPLLEAMKDLADSMPGSNRWSLRFWRARIFSIAGSASRRKT